MCLFIECAQGYHNSSLSCPHPQRALSSLPFSPLFVFDPTFCLVLLYFQQFFFPSLFIPAFISHALVAVLFVFPISPHTPPSLPACLCLPSFPFRSLSLISAPLLPLDRLLFLPLSFPPSIPPSSKAMDQGRDGLIAVWCEFAGLLATQLSSVRLVINGLCFYWYMANTSKKSNTSP